MKKILLLMLVSFAFLLASCESALDSLVETNTTTGDQDDITDTLSNEIISNALNELMHMESYETTLHFRLVTEEMNLEVNPALKYQVYTKEDGRIMKVDYNNKIMEGLGLQPFELIIDESTETLYLNDTQTWYQSTFTEIEQQLGLDDITGMPEPTDPALIEKIDQANTILIDAVQNFNKATYIETVNNGDRELAHFVLEYNVRNILKDLFDLYNQNNELGFEDFNSLIQTLELEDLALLFETFDVDVYFDTTTLQVARVELELANLLKDVYSIMEEQINTSISDENIDVETVLDYLEHLEIGVNIYNVNSLDEIIIPEGAKNGATLDLYSWFMESTNGGYDPYDGSDDWSGASGTTDDNDTNTEDSTDDSSGASEDWT
ncbi:hypothetical protein [Haloplasma contractile]|uniref:Membrane lipoprotein n=1 Tax=Haloplasma contractile SSD-17B TaxID=1033810 RepID=F7Q0Q3_9MOLU|nr:hypothetical protein [Haloplasma contractile]ERJ11963.1 membrane lipoprotein [Haloplasma contractile SSD-17B]